jgi:hypothetical protein
MDQTLERKTSLIPPRFVNAPAPVVYDDDLPAPFVVSCLRLAGLTWNQEDEQTLPPLTIDELAVLLGGKQRRAWEHLHELRRRGYLKWTKTGDELTIHLEFSTKRKPLKRMQSFAYAGEGEGDKNKYNNNLSSLYSSSTSPSPNTPMQSFALDDERVRANLTTLTEFDVSEKEPGVRETAQLEYVTPAFIRAWAAELMTTPGVKQLGRLLLHKLNNTQSWPKSEEKRGGSRKPKNNAQTPLPESDNDDEAGDEIELPIDLVDGLKAIGWTDDFVEVSEYFKRDPEHVWRCLIHARTSKKAQNKPAIFRYRLRQGGDTSSTPSPKAKRPSSRKPTSSTTEYVDDNDLF